MDTVKNYELGTVVSVETVPAQALIQDHEDKAFVLAGIEGYEDALVTVEAPYTEERTPSCWAEASSCGWA